MTPAQLDDMRDNLAEAHRLMLVANSQSGETALRGSVQHLAMVIATLVDVVTEREPMTETEFSEKVMEGKL